MSETIKVLCYKSKTLSNGEHPLMLCVCKDRKRKFQSLGISIKAELWGQRIFLVGKLSFKRIA